ncbi:MAG: hypothetical protein H6741_05050 [Alphaproteobacteria bacterium]|nr:hypothetical protein [Alphaproteobacteria bacterium]
MPVTLLWLALACAPRSEDAGPDTVTDSDPPEARCLVVTEEKLGPRGELGRRSVTTYDPEGRRVALSQDEDGDGEAEQDSRWVFGELGLLVYERRGEGGALEGREAYTYDAVGLLLRTDTDDAGEGGVVDGVIDRTTTYEYDGEARLLLESHYGYWDVRLLTQYYRFEYDAQGLLRSEETGDDEGPNRLERYSYDASQNLELIEIDTDYDGAIERWEAFTHDARGQVLTETVWDEERTRHVAYYSYDEAGRLLRYTVDSSGDGDSDYAETYSYDAEGELLRFELDEDADGAPDEVDVYQYADGRLIQHDRDEDGDGVFERRHLYSYDAQGRLARVDTLRMPSETLEDSVVLGYEEPVCSD